MIEKYFVESNKSTLWVPVSRILAYKKIVIIYAYV